MSIPIKILLVDDDKEDYLITRDIINDIPNRKYTIDWVGSYKEGLANILKQKHDVYLIDFRLGAHTGLEIINEAIKEGCKAPLILLTGQDDMTIDEQAMETGAADYLVKSKINPMLIERSIRYSIAHAKHLSEIKELNEDLEKRVEKRTAELAEAKEELTKALVKEKELNTLKSRFVSMASHEFRTPLGTILSSVSLIDQYKKPEQEEKRNKHIERIKSMVKNLTDILNDFLSLDKLDEGKVHADPDLFDLTALSREVTEEIQMSAKEGQKITYSHTGNKNEVFLDRKIMRNVITNLLNNAVKYSPENKPIEFSTGVTKKEILISVKDNGIGIPEKDRPHMFDRFFRAGNVTNIQGTGLGLNIVKRYVELMGGTISFTSEIEKGTTFTVKFPLEKNK